MIIQRTQALGCEMFFAPEGAAYANDSLGGGAGVVDSSHAPATNDPAFISLGAIEDWEHKITDEKESKSFTYNGAILVPKRMTPTQQGLSYLATTNDVTPLAMQTYYRAGQNLVQASDSLVPLSGRSPHGFILLQQKSTEGDQTNPFIVGLIWVYLKITGGFKGGDILKPTWEAMQMFSPLNKIELQQES